MTTHLDTVSDAERKSQVRLMERVNEHFRVQLRYHATRSEAVTYLKSRQLSGEVAHEFQLGFAPDGWNVLTESLGKPDLSDELLELGMLTENEDGHRYDKFRNRIIFPIRNIDGETIGFGGRVLGEGSPKYLNSPDTPLFQKGHELYGLFEGKKAITDSNQVVVVEGYMDVVALAQAQIGNSVATLGTATTPEHINLLSDHVNNIVFCFDGDKAGRAAAWKAIESSLPSLGDDLKVNVLLLPEGEDPDTLVKKIGTAGFQKLINGAPPSETYILETLQEGLDINRMDAQAAYLNKIAKLAVDATEAFQHSLIDSAMKLGFDWMEYLPMAIESVQRSVDELENARIEREDRRANTTGTERPKHYIGSSVAPMSMMRRAISLTLQYPEQALACFKDTNVDFTAPGADLLKNIIDRAAITDNQNDLIGSFADTNHYELLNELSKKDHYLNVGDVVPMISATIESLEQEDSAHRIDFLIAKATDDSLDADETQELNTLLLGTG